MICTFIRSQDIELNATTLQPYDSVEFLSCQSCITICMKVLHTSYKLLVNTYKFKTVRQKCCLILWVDLSGKYRLKSKVHLRSLELIIHSHGNIYKVGKVYGTEFAIISYHCFIVYLPNSTCQNSKSNIVYLSQVPSEIFISDNT